MTLAQTPETSVMFSLAELAHIEHERVQEEAAARAELARDEERARVAALEAERAREKARIEAEQLRRADHERAKAEDLARRSAREQAELEVARIAAAARATLDQENAARAHELEVLRLRGDSGRARLRHALFGLASLVVLGGATLGWVVHGRMSELREESQALRDDRWATAQLHEQGLGSQLAWLDARHSQLNRRADSLAREERVEAARQKSEAARSAIEASGSDTPKLHALATALEELDGVVVRAERLASYDARVADLGALAGANSRELARVVKAQRAAHEGADLAALDRALEALRQALATTGGKPVSTSARPAIATTATPPATSGRPCTNRHDPMCGPDGMLLQIH